MSARTRAIGSLTHLRPQPDQEPAVRAHLAAWHRGPGRLLPGTRLHLLLRVENGADELYALHLFETPAAYRRAVTAAEHRAWLAELTTLLREPPQVHDVAVAWNAATDVRPRVAVSIDRDVHASVQDLIGRLLDRHPRTPAEELYLNLLQSVAEEYEREYPPLMPEGEAELR